MCELFNYRGDDCHIIYKNVRDIGGDEIGLHHQSIHQNIAELWKKFKPHADTRFVEEFRRNPDQRYWEMYLGCCLLDKGFSLNTGPKGPDFRLEVGGKKIWIEAVTPTVGQENSPDRIPELILLSEGGGAQRNPRDKIILRFRAGLAEKENKFRGYVKDDTVGKGDIKVIALSSAAIRGWSKSDTNPYILGAVFPIGHAYLTLDKETRKVVGQGYEFQPAVSKAKGRPVETLFFIDPAHSDISAVIYSDADIGNPRPQLGDDLLVIHNPLAANPLLRGLLPCAREYWAVDEGNSWAVRYQDATPS